MQKALILALLIWAFLLPRYLTGQENPGLLCPDGGTFQNHPELGQICSTPAGGPGWKASISGQFHISYSDSKEDAFEKTCQKYIDVDESTSIIQRERLRAENTIQGLQCMVNHRRRDYNQASQSWGGWSNSVSNVSIQTVTADFFCPHDSYPELRKLGGPSESPFCWIEALDKSPPECDIGDCDPPDEPDCFRGGNGQLVCFEDPNEKCDVTFVNDEPVYSNCDSGCGFVQGNFICSEEPDIPSLDDCLVISTGYACPADIPEPDDDIQDPDKPIDNMVKGDFKDVLRGVETRTDATNKLISAQIARDAENTDKIVKGLDKSNAYLKQIDLNTKRTADALTGDALELEPDSANSILSGLGLTGDEDFTDLEKEVVSLDSYRSQFSWSAGSSSCPPSRSMSVLGKSFLIDWQPYCDAFGVLGYFIEAAALLISGFIAFGVRK